MIGRIRRIARKPPRYLAFRAADETRRAASRYAMHAAAKGHGGLARERIVPGGLGRALDMTTSRSLATAPWTDAIAAVTADTQMRAELASRRDDALARRLELFGDNRVSAGTPPRWSTDVLTGYSWPARFHRSIDYRNLGRPSDVKVAWEMSRLRHCVVLAQAVAVLGDQVALEALEADLLDWHDRNPMGWSVNWACAMEVALRAVNLICVDGLLLEALEDYPFRGLVVSSLYQHGWFLYRNLEISDVNGNHFLADAVGLLWLGRFFAGEGESWRWLSRGTEMVLQAGQEQVLEDGLDHEGSLPYHLLVLELFLLARFAGGDLLEAVEPTIAAMLDAACVFVGPGGRVPNIGDDDGGRALAFCDAASRDARRVLALGAAVLGHASAAVAAGPDLVHDALWLIGSRGMRQLEKLRESDRIPSRPSHLATGGLVVLGGDRDHVVLDIGPVGFRGRGGHGHLDAMSFEATLGGRVVVRDSGTGSYTGDPNLRDELRGVRAHSVVVVDGMSYARLGGPERLWAIDGDSPPQVEAITARSDRQVVAAIQQLPAAAGVACHRRELEWRPGRLRCRDEVSAPAGAAVEHLLQVPAEVEVEAGGARLGSARYRLRAPEGSVLAVEKCTTSERYGSVGPGARLVVSYRSKGEPSIVTWEIESN